MCGFLFQVLAIEMSIIWIVTLHENIICFCDESICSHSYCDKQRHYDFNSKHQNLIVVKPVTNDNRFDGGLKKIELQKRTSRAVYCVLF